MVLPGGSESAVVLAIAPTDLRQLAEHDATPRTFAGGAGPLAALDTGGGAAAAPCCWSPATPAARRTSPRCWPRWRGPGCARWRVDQRGQYESPGPDDPAAYTVAELAGDVLAVARAAAGGTGRPLHLVGHSFGGLVARAAVLADPAAVHLADAARLRAGRG